MRLEWDEQKRLANLEKHGVSFELAYDLWDSQMLIYEDCRFSYGERRWTGLGVIKKRVMLVVFTKRRFNTIRIISLRKANRREVCQYEKITAQKKRSR